MHHPENKSNWTQRMLECFQIQCPVKYLLLRHKPKYSGNFIQGTKQVTLFRWQIMRHICELFSKFKTKIKMLTREDRDLHSACPTPIWSMMAEKTDLSSALSICTGLVPRIFTPRSCSGRAKLLGICPPTDIIAPPQPYNVFSIQICVLNIL